MKLSAHLQGVINAALKDAKKKGHEFLTPEHFLMAALCTPMYRELIMLGGGDVEAIKQSAAHYLTKNIPVREGSEPVQTVSLQTIFERAAEHCETVQKVFIDVPDVIVALYDEPKIQASYLLKKFGVDRLRLLEVISFAEYSGEDMFPVNIFSSLFPENPETNDMSFFADDAHKDESLGDETVTPGSAYAGIPEDEKRKSFLERFTDDLTAKARAGGIDPIIGREDELERTIGVLCRRL
jgi:ATP-dependent Clp protease ATP-binding subunit ClpA